SSSAELFNQFFVNALLHHESGRRYADLTSIAKLAGTQLFDGRIEISIVKNQSRGMSTQLHGNPFHMSTSQRCQLLANRRRTSKGNFANDWMTDQIVGNFSRYAVNQVYSTLGNASIDITAHQLCH